MEALPPNPRDLSLSRQDSWTERRAALMRHGPWLLPAVFAVNCRCTPPRYGVHQTAVPRLPLNPEDTAQPSANPPIKLSQHARSLAEAEVASPARQITLQFSDALPYTVSLTPPRDLPNSRLEPRYRLRRDAPLWFHLSREAESQKRPPMRFCHRTLFPVYLQLERRSDELRDTLHHSLSCSFGRNVDIAVSRPGESHPRLSRNRT